MESSVEDLDQDPLDLAYLDDNLEQDLLLDIFNDEHALKEHKKHYVDHHHSTSHCGFYS